MSWSGSSRPGSSLSLHHRSWCPKPGIIGSDSTWEDATTARAAPSTGILLWNCTKRACVWILEHFLHLWLFSFAVLYLFSVLLSAGWCYQQARVCAMEGAGFGVRNAGGCLPNNQSHLDLIESVQSGNSISADPFYIIIWHQVFWFCLDRRGIKWLWEVTGETSFLVPSSHLASKPMTRVCWRSRMGNTSRSINSQQFSFLNSKTKNKQGIFSWSSGHLFLTSADSPGCLLCKCADAVPGSVQSTVRLLRHRSGGAHRPEICRHTW